MFIAAAMDRETESAQNHRRHAEMFTRWWNISYFGRLPRQVKSHSGVTKVWQLNRTGATELPKQMKSLLSSFLLKNSSLFILEIFFTL